MIVINAHINQAPDFNNFESEILLNDIQAAGIDDYIAVGEVPHLLNALEVNKHQQILLFANFSPDYFFKNNGIDVSKFRIGPMQNWRVQEYSFSAALYHHICQNYSIVGVHFITSALKRIVNDIDYLNVTGGIRTTIQRKRDWMQPGLCYKILLKKYIMDKIYAAMKSDSILIANHEILLRKPAVKFCQS